MSNGKIYTHGADSGTHTLIEFETGEFVKRIEGYSDSACVRALTLVTNKGKTSALEIPSKCKEPESVKCLLVRHVWSVWEHIRRQIRMGRC